jgi:dTMP kinase
LFSNLSFISKTILLPIFQKQTYHNFFIKPPFPSKKARQNYLKKNYKEGMKDLSCGLFVVIEGLDRSGKSTLVKSLYEDLKKKYPVFTLSFPDRKTPIGAILDKYLKGVVELNPEVQHLLFSADRYEKKELIEDLRKNTIIICDRYLWSGIIATVVKGVDLGWCIETERLLPKADLTLYLDADVDLISKRRGFGDEILETKEIQSKMRDIYYQMKDHNENLVILDASKSVKEITKEAVEEIERCFQSRSLEKLV